MNKLYRGLTLLKMKGDHFSKSSLSWKNTSLVATNVGQSSGKTPGCQLRYW
jgi:hypothetical protein